MRTRQFEVVGTDGQTHTLLMFTEYTDTTTHDRGPSEIPTLSELRTSDGRPVTYLGKGRYKMVQTGMLLHSDSPDAP
jgi:hypothetical protein